MIPSWSSAVLPGKLLETQILRLHPKPTEPETGGQSQGCVLTRASGDSEHTNIWELLFQRIFSSPIQNDNMGVYLTWPNTKDLTALKIIPSKLSYDFPSITHFSLQAESFFSLLRKWNSRSLFLTTLNRVISTWVQSSLMWCLLLWNICLHEIRLKDRIHPSLHYFSIQLSPSNLLYILPACFIFCRSSSTWTWASWGLLSVLFTADSPAPETVLGPL